VYASAIVVLELLILRQMELLFLDRFASRDAVGVYGLGRSLASTAMLLSAGVFTGLLLPAMSRTFGEDPGLLAARFLTATRYLVILVVPVVFLCEVFAGDVIVALYGGEYGRTVLVFRVAVAASALGVISSSASSYQLGSDRQPAVVGIMALVAAVTLGLDYVLIRAFGLTGAVVAGAAGSVLLGAALLRHASRCLRVTFEVSTYARCLAAGAVAVVPALVAKAVSPVWLALPAGSALALATYAALTVLLGGWTRDELRSMCGLSQPLPVWLGRPVRTLLARAEGARVPAAAESAAQLGTGGGR
jgi:O-antigen/teichoic acid export membrane protein